jgi:hypothetical protein
MYVPQAAVGSYDLVVAFMDESSYQWVFSVEHEIYIAADDREARQINRQKALEKKSGQKEAVDSELQDNGDDDDDDGTVAKVQQAIKPAELGLQMGPKLVAFGNGLRTASYAAMRAAGFTVAECGAIVSALAALREWEYKQTSWTELLGITDEQALIIESVLSFPRDFRFLDSKLLEDAGVPPKQWGAIIRKAREINGEHIY